MLETVWQSDIVQIRCVRSRPYTSAFEHATQHFLQPSVPTLNWLASDVDAAARDRNSLCTLCKTTEKIEVVEREICWRISLPADSLLEEERGVLVHASRLHNPLGRPLGPLLFFWTTCVIDWNQVQTIVDHLVKSCEDRRRPEQPLCSLEPNRLCWIWLSFSFHFRVCKESCWRYITIFPTEKRDSIVSFIERSVVSYGLEMFHRFQDSPPEYCLSTVASHFPGSKRKRLVSTEPHVRPERTIWCFCHTHTLLG